MTLNRNSIDRAADILSDAIVHTPTVAAARLSEITGAEVFLKLENLQFTGSFKDRGAGHKLAGIAASGAGVIAASAGNHAQGVAYHAHRLGLAATIVMPEHTAFAKIERTEALGADVVLSGESLAEASEHSDQLAAERGLVKIHPYDDEEIIAGQGTVAKEMLADQPDLEVLAVPIGGGGLIAGMAIYAKAVRPDLKIIGVQAELCPAMLAAVRGIEKPLQTQTIADGIAVKHPGVITRPYVEKLVDDIVLVDEDTMERAVHLLVTVQKVVAEGSGAAALSALLAHPDHFSGKRVGVVVSGGNIDARLLSNVLLRGRRREGRLVRMHIEISDAPGVLARVTGLIGNTGADIVEIHHQRLFSAVPAKLAELDVVMETRGPTHVERILADLQGQGFSCRMF